MFEANDSPKVVVDKIISNMIETRGSKYKLFPYLIKCASSLGSKDKPLSFSTRVEFLASYYSLMRYIDDVVDGDVKLPLGYSSEQEYVEQKILFSKNPFKSKDPIDNLFSYCFELADKFNEEFSKETQLILESMLFDAKRVGKNIIYSKEELELHFHDLDIDGVVNAMIKVFDEDLALYEVLKPLGHAQRIYFNLRDFDEDSTNGFYNIPIEACEYWGISEDNITDKSFSGVKNWIRSEAMKGKGLLREYYNLANNSSFRMHTHLILPIVYELPPQYGFRDMLSKVDF